MKKIQQLIAQGKLKEAIAALPSTNEVIHVQARLNELTRKEMLGTIDYSSAGIERSKILSAILSLADIDADSVSP